MITETSVFPSEVFVEQVEFVPLPVDEQRSVHREGRVVWSRRVLGAVAIAGTMIAFPQTPNFIESSRPFVVANRGGAQALSDEDIEDRLDAAALSRTYRAKKLQGLSRYREYQQKRFGRKT